MVFNFLRHYQTHVSLKCIPLLMTCLALISCAKNPVTGKKELVLIPTSQEIHIGETNYSYMQQTQGGIYKGSPELTNLVQTVGNKLVAQSDRPELPYEFVIVNDGTPNAWAMPGGKIAIHRGLLLELENEAELAAVLGHEITHSAARHTAKSMQRQLLLTVGLVGAGATLDYLDEEDEHETRNQAIIIAGAIAGQLALQKYSRQHELEADHYGMKVMAKAGYNPHAAVTLQEKFVALQNNKKDNWLSGLFASHPPSAQRVEANATLAKTLSAHPYLGEQPYQTALSVLKKQAPAYEAYDQALILMSKHKNKQALEHIEKAIALYPDESLFYGVEGDLYAKNKWHSKALKSYQKAISLNPDYYYPYLKRGLLYQKMGHMTLSKTDLEKAQVLMPTENAQAALNSLQAIG